MTFAAVAKKRTCRLFWYFVAIVACLAIATQPPAATAEAGRSGWSTIHVRSCSIDTVGPSPIERTGGITIEFVNTGAMPIAEVDFGVFYRAQPVLVKDVGTFSPGVVIKHTFYNVLYGYTYLGPTPEICRVNRVVFADGTVSEAPSRSITIPLPANPPAPSDSGGPP